MRDENDPYYYRHWMDNARKKFPYMANMSNYALQQAYDWGSEEDLAGALAEIMGNSDD